MKKKIWIAVGVIVLIGALIGVNVWRSVAADNMTVETTQLQEQEMTTTVMTPGTLKLKNEQAVYYSPEKGDVDTIVVNEGDKVEKGDELLRYTNETLNLEKEQNALSIEAGYLRINSAKKQIDRLSKKEKELAAQVGEEEAAEQIEAEREQLKMEERSANLDLKQTLLQKESIEKQLKELNVTSDVDGTVLEVDEDAIHAAGAQAEARPILRIAALDQLIIEGVISEYDTLKVAEGQSVRLTSDVVPEQEWQGKVTHIGFLPQQSLSMGGETEAVQYAIEVAVESKDIDLKPGFQMVMEIETENKTVPTLPLSAIVSREHTTVNVGINTGSVDQMDEDENIVYVVQDGKVEERIVKVGIVSGDRIEIRRGLQADELIVLDPPDNLEDGMEVTVQ